MYYVRQIFGTPDRPSGVVLDGVYDDHDYVLNDGGKDRGNILHTRNHKSETQLENVTESPLDKSSTNPLDE